MHNTYNKEVSCSVYQKMGAVELGELGKMRVPFTNRNFIRTVRGNRALESGSCSVCVESEGVFTSDLVMLTSWLQDLDRFFFPSFFSPLDIVFL